MGDRQPDLPVDRIKVCPSDSIYIDVKVVKLVAPLLISHTSIRPSAE